MCKAVIHNITMKLLTTGSLRDKKENKKRQILTEEKLDVIGALLEASLKKSLCLLSLQCGFAKGTAHIGMKLLTLALKNYSHV
jgi:hypothetical protein